MAFTKIAAAGIGSTETVTLDGLSVINDGSFGGNVSIGGTLTYEDVTNIDSVGLITARNGIVVGSGITLSKDGDGYYTGVVTATSYKGDGSGLTGIDATQILTGNTSVQTVDTGSDGHVKVTTEGTERVNITNTGGVKILGQMSGNNIAQISNHSGGFQLYGSSNSATYRNIIFCTASNDASEKMRIESGGQVGIGTINPGSKLEVLDDDVALGSDGNIMVRATTSGADKGGQITFGTNLGRRAAIAGNQETTGTTGYLQFGTRAASGDITERMRITSAGNLVVGTTASNNLIHAQGSGGTPTISVKNTSGACTLYAESSSGNIAKLDLVQSGTSSFSLRTGASDALMFYRDTTEYARFDNGGRLVISTSVNSSTTVTGGALPLQVVGSGGYTGASFIRTNNAGAQLQFAAGSSGTNVGDNNGLGYIKFFGYHTNGYDEYARIHANVNGTNGDGDAPGELIFSTTGDGASSVTERVHIDAAGRVILGSYSATASNFNLESNHANLHVNTFQDGGQGGIYIHSNGTGGGTASPHYGIKLDSKGCANNASLQASIIIDLVQQYTQAGTGVLAEVNGNYNKQKCFDGQLMKALGAYTDAYTYHSNIVTTSSGGTAFHAYFQDNGTLKFRVYQNGNAQNANNSWGSTSDVKLKENIVDASSQWADIKAIKVRNFNFKASTGQDTSKHIGVIAQELETVSPGLVHTDNDTTMDEATGEGTVTGTTKSVKYSILYMKAIKALQEAMTRIETLETEVAALKSS